MRFFADTRTLLCGSGDILVVERVDDETSTLYLGIYDLKRSKKISSYSFGGKCGKGPLAHVADCNLQKYTNQLGLYQWMIETFYPSGWVYKGKTYDHVKVVKRVLVVCHPNHAGRRRRYPKYTPEERLLGWTVEPNYSQVEPEFGKADEIFLQYPKERILALVDELAKLVEQDPAPEVWQDAEASDGSVREDETN